jgi:prophage DNA circulation protein
MADSPWRARLRPASFRGVPFHVEVGGRSAGRRLAFHEFPKRDVPYTEDLGRRGRAFPITGYCIGPFYLDERDDLLEALDEEGAGTLVHPTLGEFEVKVGQCAAQERRERGGYVEIEMQFFEAGEDDAFDVQDDTQDQLRTQASSAGSTAATAGDAQLAKENEALNRALAAGA